MIFSKSVFFAVLIIFSGTYVSGQEQDQVLKYGHYTGRISEDMNVSADLHFIKSEAHGFYYYYFMMPGMEKKTRYSKTIPLSGNIYDSNIELKEYGNDQSFFRGKITDDTLFAGVWVDNKKGKSLSFSMSENYSSGSIAFNVYYLKDFQPIKGTKPGERTGADIDLCILLPSDPDQKALTDSLKKIIPALFNSPGSIPDDPSSFLKKIKTDYFNLYNTTTEGVAANNNGSSFDWAKKMRMNIFYNQDGLLCIQFVQYVHTGGAQGLTKSKYLVFSVKSGKKISLNNLVTEGARPALDSLLDHKLREQYEILPHKNLKEEGFFVEKVTACQNFYINRDGIGFYYNTYEVASATKGPVDIFLTFKELSSVLRKENFQGLLEN